VETSQLSISADRACSFSTAKAARYNGSSSLAFFDGKASSSSRRLSLGAFQRSVNIKHSEFADML
jgi:hypothetical protein